jgi:hypothetical protein
MSDNEDQKHFTLSDEVYNHPVFKELYDSIPEHLKSNVDEHIRSLHSRVSKARDNLQKGIINQGKIMEFIKSADEAMYKTFCEKDDNQGEGEE